MERYIVNMFEASLDNFKPFKVTMTKRRMFVHAPDRRYMGPNRLRRAIWEDENGGMFIRFEGLWFECTPDGEAGGDVYREQDEAARVIEPLRRALEQETEWQRICRERSRSTYQEKQ